MKPSILSQKSAAFPALLRRLVLAWLMAVTAEYLLLPGAYRSLEDISVISRMSAVRVLSVTFFLSAVFHIFSRKQHFRHSFRYIPKKTDQAGRLGILLSFIILTIFSLISSFSPAFLAACTGIALLLFLFWQKGWNALPDHPKNVCQSLPGPDRKTFLLICFFSILFFLFVSIWTVSRVYCFCTPTFDFGLFSQMFHYMRTTGIPLTTLERDGALSHLQVHVSPIYYLLLPFYCLAPVPATLQILQAAVMTSAVIPLWKLGKLHGLTGWQQLFFCMLLFLYPAFCGGAGYDIHENCFLTPLLLWLFYGIDRRRTGLTAVSALLVLLVKEDAPVYVASIALWLLTSSLLHQHPRGLAAGSLLLVISLTYFFAATGYLGRFGDGVMLHRYANFLPADTASLSSILKTFLVWPMKVLHECADPEKLRFLAMTLLPLLGFPLFTRRWERYLLLIPFVLVNLLPDYLYQHDIFFQYVFGSTACLLYLTLVNLADLQAARFRQCLPVAAILVSTVCFGTVIIPKAMDCPVRYIRNRDYYRTLTATLAQIPPDASVTASTFYTTPLSQRDTVYDLKYTSEAHLFSTEYIVFDPSADGTFQTYETKEQSGPEGFRTLLEENGYLPFAETDGIMIYHRNIS